jgi:hypothetical protein
MRAPWSAFVTQPENGLRFAKSGEFEVAQRHEFLRQMARESRRGDDYSPKTGGNFLQPRGAIDGRTDAGEVEARARANIAVKRVADVQRESEAERLNAIG